MRKPVAAIAVFLPCYLLVVIPAPFYRRFADNLSIKAFVDGYLMFEGRRNNPNNRGSFTFRFVDEPTMQRDILEVIKHHLRVDGDRGDIKLERGDEILLLRRAEGSALAGQWFLDNADKVKGGSKLQSPDTATTVRMDGAGDPVVVDGPFVEGKEVVSGYAEVEADDLDDVLRIVKTWPGCPVVEIRPLES